MIKWFFSIKNYESSCPTVARRPAVFIIRNLYFVFILIFFLNSQFILSASPLPLSYLPPFGGIEGGFQFFSRLPRREGLKRKSVYLFYWFTRFFCW